MAPDRIKMQYDAAIANPNAVSQYYYIFPQIFALIDDSSLAAGL